MLRNMRSVSYRRGLTLVELLVVIAIILTLATVLLWALWKVRAAVLSLGKPPEQKEKEPPKPPEPPPPNAFLRDGSIKQCIGRARCRSEAALAQKFASLGKVAEPMLVVIEHSPVHWFARAGSDNLGLPSAERAFARAAGEFIPL